MSAEWKNEIDRRRRRGAECNVRWREGSFQNLPRRAKVHVDEVLMKMKRVQRAMKRYEQRAMDEAFDWQAEVRWRKK